MYKMSLKEKIIFYSVATILILAFAFAINSIIWLIEELFKIVF